MEIVSIDLNEDALTRAVFRRLDGGIKVCIRDQSLPLCHLVNGVLALAVVDVSPVDFLDVGEAVVVHLKDGGFDFGAETVAGAEIMIIGRSRP